METVGWVTQPEVMLSNFQNANLPQKISRKFIKYITQVQLQKIIWSPCVGGGGGGRDSWIIYSDYFN